MEVREALFLQIKVPYLVCWVQKPLGDGRNTLLTARGDLAEVFQPVLPQEYNRNNEPLSSGCCTTRASVQAVLLCLYLPPCQAVHVVHQEVTSAQAA